ncbi:hypothetical protein [Rhizobium sp. K102]|uniref:hypothetical protein n=1 Tax=Rhizobium sp. K102 TaxID=2918527 RepID=UPI001EFB83A0|nr:hypothetical protein [Rhizobium sp. K102]ULR45660.1 hypothetical protein MHI61_10905 [Rhizobium sp. K102]
MGSSAIGIMVRRDIDITMSCPRLDAGTLEAFAGIGARLMQKAESVVAVRFRNDTGAWNTEPDKYPDGFYLWLSVRTQNQSMWTIDIWLVDQPDRQPDLAHLKTLLPRMKITTAKRSCRSKKPWLSDRRRKIRFRAHSYMRPLWIMGSNCR